MKKYFIIVTAILIFIIIILNLRLISYKNENQINFDESRYYQKDSDSGGGINKTRDGYIVLQDIEQDIFFKADYPIYLDGNNECDERVKNINDYIKSVVYPKQLAFGWTTDVTYSQKSKTENFLSLEFTLFRAGGKAVTEVYCINLDITNTIPRVVWLSEFIGYNDIKQNFNTENFIVKKGVVKGQEEYNDALEKEEDIIDFYVTGDNKLGIVTEWHASAGSTAVFESTCTIDELE